MIVIDEEKKRNGQYSSMGFIHGARTMSGKKSKSIQSENVPNKLVARVTGTGLHFG